MPDESPPELTSADIIAANAYNKVHVPGASQEHIENKLNEYLPIAQEGLSEGERKGKGIDPLTGLPNSLQMDEKALEACNIIARTGKENGPSTKPAIAFMMVDVNLFKVINDIAGHDEGDRVIQSIGEILRDSLRRSTDTAGRLGGDEFGVIFVVPPGENSAQNFIGGIEAEEGVIGRLFEGVNQVREALLEKYPSLKSYPGTATLSVGLKVFSFEDVRELVKDYTVHVKTMKTLGRKPDGFINFCLKRPVDQIMYQAKEQAHKENRNVFKAV